MKTLRLKPQRDRSVLRHHPWIFSGAIDEGASRVAGAEITVGETVQIVDAAGKKLGYGSYSPQSQIRVRMLSFDPACVPSADLVRTRVESAVQRRAPFFASGTYTNAVRLVNAESDGLPGVVADSYDGFVVCQFTSAGAEYWKSTIVEAFRECVPGCRGVAERADLKDREKEGLASAEAFRVLAGEEPPERIAIFEGSVRYYVDVRKGHKTGFYLDQRLARQKIGELARGRSVLNCFSYTGGFGLFARQGGATAVTQVDISEEALSLARENEKLTGGEGVAIDYQAADVFAFLRACRDANRRFDLIVLDPPKFASSKAQVMKAARGYKDINLLAMKLLNPNGILATFSCSGAMTSELFDQVLAEAACDAHRDFQMIARTRQDVDHPVLLSFPEGLYLKGVVLRLV